MYSKFSWEVSARGGGGELFWHNDMDLWALSRFTPEEGQLENLLADSHLIHLRIYFLDWACIQIKRIYIFLIILSLVLIFGMFLFFQFQFFPKIQEVGRDTYFPAKCQWAIRYRIIDTKIIVLQHEFVGCGPSDSATWWPQYKNQLWGAPHWEKSEKGGTSSWLWLTHSGGYQCTLHFIRYYFRKFMYCGL